MKPVAERVVFPRGTARCRVGVGVSFRATLDDTLVVCEVALDALVQLFGAKSGQCQALIGAFEQNREVIESAARKLLESTLSSNGVKLTTADFQNRSLLG